MWISLLHTSCFQDWLHPQMGSWSKKNKIHIQLIQQSLNPNILVGINPKLTKKKNHEFPQCNITYIHAVILANNPDFIWHWTVRKLRFPVYLERLLLDLDNDLDRRPLTGETEVCGEADLRSNHQTSQENYDTIQLISLFSKKKKERLILNQHRMGTVPFCSRVWHLHTQNDYIRCRSTWNFQCD